ncbi:chemotaxis protein CheX [Angustibacter luteus]|uniref:Chemotaxis protein CheX n=1 Tax=Angustibacter luteus TaxID=658456 RepID=A0ABW1JHV4_9ACTN
MTTTTGVAPIRADEVWELVAEVWESLLQLPAIRADHAFGLQGAMTASVTIDGDWTGLVTVTMPPTTAVAVTRAMLQIPETDDVSDADVADAVGEVVNVIGGNVKALLQGSTSLGLPRVELEWAPVHAQLVCRAGVEWPGHAARIGVWHLPSTATSNDSMGEAR